MNKELFVLLTDVGVDVVLAMQELASVGALGEILLHDR